VLVSEEAFIRTSMAVDKSVAIRKAAKGGICTDKSVRDWYNDYFAMCEYETPSESGNIRVFVDTFVSIFE